MYRKEDRFTEDWTAAERSAYGTLTGGPTRPLAGSRVPTLVRETLLAMSEDTPDDEDLTRTLEVVALSAPEHR